VNRSTSSTPYAERKISRRAQLMGAAGLVAGVVGAQTATARADSTPSGPLTIQSSSSTDVPLTLVGAAGQRADYLAINEADGSSIAKINAGGTLYLGSATRQAVVRFRGNPSYSPTEAGEETVWEMGLDTARDTKYRDFFLAQRTGPSSVADLLYINAQAQGQQPVVSIASPGDVQTHRSTLMVGVWGTDVSQNYHNLAILVRDTDTPAQTGKALTVISETDNEIFSVGVDGATKWRSPNGNLRASVAPNGDIMSVHQIATTMTGWVSAGGTGLNVDYGGVEAMGGMFATSARPQIVSSVVKAMTGQTADLLQCQDTASKPHFSVTASGLPKWGSGADQQTSVGPPGGAAKVPDRPAKYLKVVDNSGNTYVIPAFQVS
jgi:hypothetical protein